MESSSHVPNADPVPSEIKSGDQLRPTPTPPYWNPSREASLDSTALLVDRPGPITLEDHTLSREVSRSGLWAKSITIDDYVIIQGSLPGVGAYVVYNCNVQTLDGGPLRIRKRYSEFDELRCKLIKAFPQSTKSSLPPLPPKSAIYKFRPKFLEKRRESLAYFLNCVMLNPDYAGSSIIKDFICPIQT